MDVNLWMQAIQIEERRCLTEASIEEGRLGYAINTVYHYSILAFTLFLHSRSYHGG